MTAYEWAVLFLLSAIATQGWAGKEQPTKYLDIMGRAAIGGVGVVSFVMLPITVILAFF